MPMADPKPLFRPEALRPRLAHFSLPASIAALRPKLAQWALFLGSPVAQTLKESELLPDFLSDVCGEFLGYTGPAAAPGTYTLKREATVKVDGKFADAVLGRFAPAGPAHPLAVIEGKGPRDPLDRPFAGRKLSAVDQALRYAVNLLCDWYLVTNLNEIRLYHKGHDQATFERFDITALATDDRALRRFLYLLSADRVVPPAGPSHLDALLAESRKVGLDLTRDFYRDYAALRRRMFDILCRHNPAVPPADVLTATQKVLDRVLFIAFCEDRGLLPAESITKAFHHADPYNLRPVWHNFLALFRAVNEGSPALGIDRYNGGLFAPDAMLESLTVPDTVCSGFDRLAAYEYRAPTPADDDEAAPATKLIDVDILGHIFEQSISDLESLRQEIESGPAPDKAAPSKRKREGAFYTPAFITRYIVEATLGPVLAARFEALRSQHEAAAPATARKVLADPSAFDPKALKPAAKTALVRFWEAWHEHLTTLRLVDPACGSGAFLIEAFDHLHRAYAAANDRLQELHGALPFDIHREILRHNLYGVDLNTEAVEICRLGLWIKTARKGEMLTSLDHTIRAGNSVIADPAVHPRAFDWQAAFPEVFAAGGFDVVLGNPPYVRQEWISAYKPYFQAHYRSYNGTADLYVYFYELGLNLLRPGGRLGFVVTNKWMKAGYGEELRRFLAEGSWVESVVDFGHAKQIFEDADVFPCILVARKPTADPPPETARVCAIPREQLRIDDLARQIEVEGFEVERSKFGADAWSLEPPAVEGLLEKICQRGTPLREYAGDCLYRGILTGFNEAFLLQTLDKDRIVAADPKCAELFRRYVRGQDMDRWQAEWNGFWMLALKSSANHAWPWSDAGDQVEQVFATTYPAIHAHLNQYREALIKRQDQGVCWWELRSCAYWDRFERPKVFYMDIAWRPSFCLDTRGTLANNTTYFLSTDDRWLLAVLNAPVSWWYAWRRAQHGKDEALRFFTAFMEQFPIPRPTEDQRTQAHALGDRLIAMTADRHEGRRAVLDWLRVEHAIDKPSLRLQAVDTLDVDTLVAEAKKSRGKKNPLTVASLKSLKEEQARSIAPLQSLAKDAAALERQLSNLVNAAYALTPEEVTLLWQTAPPRMPGGCVL